MKANELTNGIIFLALAIQGYAANSSQFLEVEATAYCPCEKCCGIWASRSNKTALGRLETLPGIAVDPKVIQLGSKVYIEGMGWLIADDVGGAIKGNRIDIRMKTHLEAKKWGRRKIKIEVKRL